LIFRTPSTQAAPTCSVSPATGTKNVLGTSNGKIRFTIEPGTHFPKYGGTITFTIPTWYGANLIYVFSSSPATTCSSAQLDIVLQQLNDNQYTIRFKKYTPASSIIIECSNYRNPVYKKIVSGFSMTVEDNESIQNKIMDYNDWSLDGTGLDQVEYAGSITKQFYINDVAKKPVPVQMISGLEFSF